MLSYNKLWILLESKGMKKTDLKAIMSGSTLAKLGKNETVSSAVIANICEFLDCQPGDIMEYISEQKAKEIIDAFDQMNKSMMEVLKTKGITEEQFTSALIEMMPDIAKSLYNNENTLTNLFEKGIEECNEKKDEN